MFDRMAHLPVLSKFRAGLSAFPATDSRWRRSRGLAICGSAPLFWIVKEHLTYFHVLLFQYIHAEAVYYLLCLLFTFLVTFTQSDPESTEQQERRGDRDSRNVEWPSTRNPSRVLIMS